MYDHGNGKEEEEDDIGGDARPVLVYTYRGWTECQGAIGVGAIDHPVVGVGVELGKFAHLVHCGVQVWNGGKM